MTTNFVSRKSFGGIRSKYLAIKKFCKQCHLLYNKAWNKPRNFGDESRNRFRAFQIIAVEFFIAQVPANC